VQGVTNNWYRIVRSWIDWFALRGKGNHRGLPLQTRARGRVNRGENALPGDPGFGDSQIRIEDDEVGQGAGFELSQIRPAL
jgi:hypothetical protein